MPAALPVALLPRPVPAPCCIARQSTLQHRTTKESLTKICCLKVRGKLLLTWAQPRDQTLGSCNLACHLLPAQTNPLSKQQAEPWAHTVLQHWVRPLRPAWRLLGRRAATRCGAKLSEAEGTHTAVHQGLQLCRIHVPVPCRPSRAPSALSSPPHVSAGGPASECEAASFAERFAA